MCSQNYREFYFDGLDYERLWHTLNTLVTRHPMLRATLVDEQTRQVVCVSRSLAVDIAANQDFAVQRKKCMCAFASSPELFMKVCVTDKRMSGGRICLHVLYDMLFVDAMSVRIVAQEALALYCDPYVQLPPLHATFENWCRERVNQVASIASRNYFASRLDTIPGPPQLPRVKTPPSANATTLFERSSVTIDASTWISLQKHTAVLKATPSALMLAILFEALSFHADEPYFSIIITRSERPMGADYSSVVGDFTGAMLQSMRSQRGGTPGSLISSVFQDTTEIVAHGDMTSEELIRMLRAHHADPNLLFPVVFTSFLGIKMPTGFNEAMKFHRTQTPQVELDVKLVELDDDRVLIDFDYSPLAYCSQTIGQLLETYRSLLSKLATFRVDELASRDLCLDDRILHVECERVFERSNLLHEIVFEAARMAPSKVAIIDQTTKLSFEVTMQLVSAGSRALVHVSATEGKCVAIVCEKGWE